MKVMITGGHTEVPIDKVRSVTNIFKGRTALSLAAAALLKGHDVTLVGNLHMVDERLLDADRLRFEPFRTFDELENLMKKEVQEGAYDCIIHSAAVSDYYVSRVLDKNLEPINNAGKVGSNYTTMYLEMKQTRKIIDEIRAWGFKNTLVKFKLQVGISDEELLVIARKSRWTSNADLIVANCLEWAKDKAYIVGDGIELCVSRSALPTTLFNEIASVRGSR